ncbi:DEKNAAC104087 [Brettanomyces naardenensis]|uniref:tRNA-dihydrouridine synthase n=1 Tax=Brettanomyces naardenensis TaxID=13370 RepID=A0A448YPV2_BRENA|nr:DEKNAAC104087 [Brettanomyces naardenensis]
MADFTAKLVLAPMVRIGELPTRLLALKYGADLVWSPEIVDRKILTCERVYNKDLDTVDFLSSKGNKKIPGVTDLVFRTYRKLEKDRLIFQMGTANPELAVKAAKIIVKDVDGIDINAGCPKHFSIHSGMGAALLSTPDLLCSILTSLVEQVGKPERKPISVKIRLLEEKKDTLDLVVRLVKTGITNLTVHFRTREMRNREDPIRDYLDDIHKICKENNVSLIVNGGIRNYDNYKEIQSKYGSDVGCMIASAAERNVSCFRSQGQLNWPQVAKDYIETATRYNNHPSNIKYCLLRMVPGTASIHPVLNGLKESEEMRDALINIMGDDGEVKAGRDDITDDSRKRRRDVVENVDKRIRVNEECRV